MDAQNSQEEHKEEGITQEELRERKIKPQDFLNNNQQDPSTVLHESQRLRLRNADEVEDDDNEG